MASSPATAEQGVTTTVRRRHAPSGVPLYLIGALVAVLLLAPLVILVIDAATTGWAGIAAVLFRERSAALLGNTLLLVVTVTPATAALGTGAAWLTERSRLPGRRIWTVLLVLPLAMPDFVVGYAWHTSVPHLNPLLAATIVMTLSTYPLVYLPVAAALRRTDPALTDVSRTLGRGPWHTLARVVLPSISPALLSGSLLVVLALLSEYGAFEILRFQTFTTEIFTQFQFEPNAAAALSIPLVLLALLALVGEAALPRARFTSRATQQRGQLVHLGRAAVPVLAGLVALIGAAVLMPLATLVYWMARSPYSTLPPQATLGQATATTLGYSATGAALAVIAALPVAFLSARHRTKAAFAIDRASYVIQALPGVIIAVCLVFFAIRAAHPLYQTSTLLVIAYALLNFPLALSCVRTSVLQAPVALSETGRTLGKPAPAVFARVTLPLIAPGIVAGFCLVFLMTIAELTATLVLIPFNTQTLATEFWAYQSAGSYGAAAPYALVIIAISLVPGALLALWFDRGARIR